MRTGVRDSIYALRFNSAILAYNYTALLATTVYIFVVRYRNIFKLTRYTEKQLSYIITMLEVKFKIRTQYFMDRHILGQVCWDELSGSR